MGVFSTRMRTVAFNLIIKRGNSCTLSKVTVGTYDPTAGKSGEAIKVINTHSAPSKSINIVFGSDGPNTGLTGFNESKVTVPYLGVNEIIDETWLYNDKEILRVEPVETEDDIIVFDITVASG